MLKNKFYILCQNFNSNNDKIDLLWYEIQQFYSQESRYYHTLNHLEYIYKSLESIELTSSIGFAIFYHDIIYNIKEHNNEINSAKLAIKRLKELHVPLTIINQVRQLIIQTQTHQSSSIEGKLFLDADLAILGTKDKDLYQQYQEQIRAEYKIYDDYNYKKGRRSVLKNFMKKEKIYSSDFFYKKYEQQAQENILKEYNSLVK